MLKLIPYYGLSQSVQLINENESHTNEKNTSDKGFTVDSVNTVLDSISTQIKIFQQENKNFLLNVKFQVSESLLSKIKWAHGSFPQNSRQHEIWKQTCFEFFIKPENCEHYLEFNLNQLGWWNLYEFQRYRFPQPPVEVESAQLVHFDFNLSQGLIEASIEFNYKQWNQIKTWQVSLTAITEYKIEQNNIEQFKNRQNSIEHKECWALKHCDQQPNFHHQDSFILNIYKEV